ncbi:hypothetical protein [Vibrio porteresiae]|uniref:Sel1 repeat family protein n=1 Tax=Vibrio porteresiae DSM 19223 TaxID=1123496 RepID=A0ABZ0Q833_9VIBR|nr:hypothetical protein [Vibrio porteresiae]WPC72597.1 hypothetical protein R8Z52_10700 [Vibrio porteresiae DSM 19223]
MKFISIMIFISSLIFGNLCLANTDENRLPELNSAAWSSKLTPKELSQIRFDIYLFTSKGVPDSILKDFPKYIEDKDNIEMRYLYALSILYQYKFPSALKMIKELSIEGYPYAMESYGEERVCDLDKYKNACDENGYRNVLKKAYLDWVRKDPLVINMYYSAFVKTSKFRGYKDNYGNELSIEGEKILKEGTSLGCYRCSYELYNFYKSQEEKKITGAKSNAEYYYKSTKNIIIEAKSWYAGSVPNLECFTHESRRNYPVCLNDKEQKTLMYNLAKKGNIGAFDAMILYKNWNSDLSNDDRLYDYIRSDYDDSQFSKYTLPLYKKAIEINDGAGWGSHGYLGDISSWEKLYNDTHEQSFWKKLKKLL